MRSACVGQMAKPDNDRFAAARRPDALGVRFDGADGAFLAGDIKTSALFRRDHRTQLEPVVERHHAAGEAEQD